MTDLLLADVVRAIGHALVHSTWQCALVGVLAGGALRLARDASPQLRYLIAAVSLLLCVVLPILTAMLALFANAPATPIAGFDAMEADVAWSGASNDVAVNTPTTFDAMLPALVAAWAAGASLFCLRTLLGVAWVRRMRAVPQPPLQLRWQETLDALSIRFGLRGVALRLVEDLDTPVAAGWWRPVVLLPMSIALRMPAAQVEALLAHELAHVRRHDYLVNLLQRVVEALLFFHPVAWWLSRRVRIERELVADRMAADVLGDGRRLALALAALSELPVPVRPLPHVAPAAHGGSLMSRIQQLISKQPAPAQARPVGRIALPLVGIAAACVAFLAQAQIGERARTEAQVAGANAQHSADAAERVRAAAETTSAISGKAATEAAEAAHAAGHAQFKAAESAARAARAKQSTQTAQVTRISMDDDEDDAWAIVRQGKDGYSMSGSTGDMDDISAAKRAMNRDFIWYRRDGKAWVIDDPATVARVQAAWKDSDVIGEKMSKLGDEMSVHGKKMEGLGKQMEKLSGKHVPSQAMMDAQRRMGALAAEQSELAGKQQLAAMKQSRADTDAEQDALDKEMDALGAQMDKLGDEMDRTADILERESQRLEASSEPMEALGRQMEEAGKPMEALGEQMDVLGKQQETLVRKAEKDMKVVIGDAEKKGLAKPAPGARSAQ